MNPPEQEGEGIERRLQQCQRIVDDLTNRGESITVHDAIALTQHASTSSEFAGIWIPRFSKVLTRWDDDTKPVWQNGRATEWMKNANPGITWSQQWNWLDAIRLEWPRTMRAIGANLVALNALVEALSPEGGTEWWLTTPMAVAAPLAMPGFISIFWGAPGAGKSDIMWSTDEELEKLWNELRWQIEHGERRKSLLWKLTEKFCPQVLNSGRNTARIGLVHANEFKIVTNIMALPPEPGREGLVDPFQKQLYDRIVYCNKMSQFQRESADVEEDTFCAQQRDESGPGFSNTRSLSDQHKSIEDEIRYKRKDNCSLAMLTQDAIKDFPKYMFDDTRPGCASLIVRKKPAKQNGQPNTARVSIGALGWRGKLITEIPPTGVLFRSRQKSTFQADIRFDEMLADLGVAETNALRKKEPWGDLEERMFIVQYCEKNAGGNIDQRFLNSATRNRMVLRDLLIPDKETGEPPTHKEIAESYGVSEWVVQQIVEKDERKRETLRQAREMVLAEKRALEQEALRGVPQSVMPAVS